MQVTVETTKMSTKGQVIIPKNTREFTNSTKETNFTVFPIDKETIVLKKINSEKIIKEFRDLRAKIKDKLTDAEVNEIVHKTRQAKSGN